jgi:integrase/recombinase XerC
MVTERNEIILTQFEEYLTQIALSPKTITNYLADLRVFTRWAEANYIDGFSLTAVTSDQIRAYRRYLLEDQGRAPSTINRHLQALRKCCAYIAQTRLAPGNAAEEVSLVTSKNQNVAPSITDEEVAAFLAAVNNARASIAKRNTAIISLLVHAGLRVAEVIDLQTDDVVFDYPGVHLTIRDSRGQGTRNIPLPNEVCRAIKEWLAIRPRTTAFSNVFLSQEGKPISPRTVQRIVSGCAKMAGLKGITAQLLRRIYAYQLLKVTNDLELVCQRLGHQNQKITLRYLNLSKKKIS